MTHNFAAASWRKSSRSSDHIETSCVEVAHLGQRIGVRDSKDPTGPILTLNRLQLAALLNVIKTSELA